MANVRLEDVSKYFGDLEAVSDVNVEIEDGEFFVLLGPSGCGKTTTLRMISGLERPSEGTIYFDEEDVTDQKPAERNISMVFQNYALYPHKTVRENISFPLSLSRRNASQGEIDSETERVAKLLEIEDQLDKRPKNLSGGQQQRVALGRAIIREPSVFLMDEPLSNLDAKLRIQMRSELNQLHRELGVTTVYVTHDQTEAMSLADRICVLNEGTVQQIGTPHEVFSRPTNAWVAGFIGDPPMNFLRVSLDRSDGVSYLRGGNYRFRIADEDADEIENAGTADALTLGVRPRDYEVVEQRGDDTIPGTILTVEPTGERSILTADIEGTETKVETEPQEYMGRQGEDVHLRPNKTYFYKNDGDLLTVTNPPERTVEEVRGDGGR